MAIKIYGHVFSLATQRAVACLQEKELEFEFILVDLAKGEQKSEAFLAINPFGQVPALEDGDLKLFESRAISNYLAHTYANKGTPLIIEDPKKMAIVNVWQEVETLRFDSVASKLSYEIVVKPFLGLTTDDSVVQQFEPQLAKVLDVYESRLAQSKYLGGDSFTLADLNHLPVVNSLMGTKIKALFDARPHVSAWAADILARPAWQKVVGMQQKHN